MEIKNVFSEIECSVLNCEHILKDVKFSEKYLEDQRQDWVIQWVIGATARLSQGSSRLIAAQLQQQLAVQD